MENYLYTINTDNVQDLQDDTKEKALVSLESGKPIFFPNYTFTPQAIDKPLLSESTLNKKHKNISYDYLRQHLAGIDTTNPSPALPELMTAFMHRFALFSKQLLETVIPQYTKEIRWGRTSYRPAEIKGRVSSSLRDDTRIHVDSFSATPVNGLRILRVFCNINPYGEPRVWHIGEPFSQVLQAFAPRISPYSASRAKLLKLIKVTKTLRSPYDHYMLNLHDKMKLDDRYQRGINKQRIDFPAQSTWIVFTDHVSHAALSGQFLLEQTFYLPVTAMLNPSLSPLKLLENSIKR